MSTHLERLRSAHKVIEQECTNKTNIEIQKYFKRLAPLYDECMQLGNETKEYHYAEYLKTLLEIGLLRLIGSKDTKDLNIKAKREQELAGL